MMRPLLCAVLFCALQQTGSGISPASTESHGAGARRGRSGAAGAFLEPDAAAFQETDAPAAFQKDLLLQTSLHHGTASDAAPETDGGPGTRGKHPLWRFEGTWVWEEQVLQCAATLFLAGILCSAGGIGGGGIYVTVLMVFGGITTEDAVPLSKAIVFLGSISSLVLNVRKATSPGEVLIDYDICRIVVPASLIGTYLGVILNWMLPNWLLVLILSLMLVGMTVTVTRTTVLQYMEEERAKAVDSGSCLEEAQEDEATESPASSAASEPSTPTWSFSGSLRTSANSLSVGPASAAGAASAANEPATQAAEGCSGVDARAPAKASAAAARPPQPRKAFADEAAAHAKQQCSRNVVSSFDTAVAATMLLGVVVFGAFRFHASGCKAAQGIDVQEVCHHPAFAILGDAMKSWMREGPYGNLLVNLAFLIPLSGCAGVLLCCSKTLVEEQQGWRYVDVLMYSLVSIVTGCLAGLVGIGGGLVFAPFFLLMGVEPAVAVATSSTCVIFTSSSTTLQYLLTDRIILSLCLVYGIVNLVASYAGTSLVHYLQDALSARRSFITAIVAAGVLISTVLSVDKLLNEMGVLHDVRTALLFTG